MSKANLETHCQKFVCMMIDDRVEMLPLRTFDMFKRESSQVVFTKRSDI